MRCESFWESVAQPLLGIVLIQSFPLFWANDPSKKLAFANGQYILVRRDAYRRAGGHEGVRDKFVEDIYLARAVKGLGLSSRTAIAQGIGSTRMYTSLPQFIRGWSRILYDALGRNPWKLLLQGLDPLFFSQTAHVALVASLVMLALGRPGGPFAWWLLGLSVAHHLLALYLPDATLRPLRPPDAARGLVSARRPGPRRDPLPRHPDVPDRPGHLARDGLSGGPEPTRIGRQDHAGHLIS